MNKVVSLSRGLVLMKTTRIVHDAQGALKISSIRLRPGLDMGGISSGVFVAEVCMRRQWLRCVFGQWLRCVMGGSG